MRQFLVLCYLILYFSVHSQDYVLRYEATGGRSDHTIYIWNSNGDSLCQRILLDKIGALSLNLSEPSLITVSINFNDAGAKRFYIDEKGIDAAIDFDANTISIKPTTLNTELDSFIVPIRGNIEQVERRAFAMARIAKSLKVKPDSLLNDLTYIEKAYNELRYIQALNAPGSYLSLESLFIWTINGEMDKDRLLVLLHKLDKALQKYPSFKLCKMVLEDDLKKYKVGDVLPSCDLIDAGGSKRNIRDLVKGKITYIDLWALGCHSSRDAHHKLDTLHQKYKGQIEFISICDEASPDNLKFANAQDRINWTSLYDPEGHLSPFLYQIGAGYTPYGILIDKDGKIMAKDLRPESLEAEIKQILESSR